MMLGLLGAPFLMTVMGLHESKTNLLLYMWFMFLSKEAVVMTLKAAAESNRFLFV